VVPKHRGKVDKKRQRFNNRPKRAGPEAKSRARRRHGDHGQNYLTLPSRGGKVDRNFELNRSHGHCENRRKGRKSVVQLRRVRIRRRRGRGSRDRVTDKGPKERSRLPSLHAGKQRLQKIAGRGLGAEQEDNRISLNKPTNLDGSSFTPAPCQPRKGGKARRATPVS